MNRITIQNPKPGVKISDARLDSKVIRELIDSEPNLTIRDFKKRFGIKDTKRRVRI